VVSSWECGSKPSGSIKDRKLLVYLSDYYLVKNFFRLNDLDFYAIKLQCICR
jgi:hypothetical protein